MMDIRKLIMAMVDGEKWEIGRKICDLSPELVAEHEIFLSQARAITEQRERLALEERRIDLNCEDWWNKIKAQHQCAGLSLHCEDGAIYEYIRKEVKS